MLWNKWLTLGLYFFGVSICPIASANDSSIGDDNGTIEFKSQPDISMDKESLTISEKNIHVDYVFTNTSQQDLVIPIAFPMPPMYFGSSDHTGIEDFKLWVNGKPLKTERKLVVLLDGDHDISEKVQQLGWDEDSLVSFLSSGELPAGKKPLPEEWLEEYDQPRFTLNEYFVWRQSFAAGKPVYISHSYTPSVTTGVPRSADDIIGEYKQEVCLDITARNGLKKRQAEYGYGVLWARLSYILMTANNWQGPVKDFHLIIKKQQATDMLSLCFDDELKKTDSVTFEFHKQNYQPKRDLELLFIRNME